jgi:hypothetical protein
MNDLIGILCRCDIRPAAYLQIADYLHSSFYLSLLEHMSLEVLHAYEHRSSSNMVGASQRGSHGT